MDARTPTTKVEVKVKVKDVSINSGLCSGSKSSDLTNLKTKKLPECSGTFDSYNATSSSEPVILNREILKNGSLNSGFYSG